ncbi:hypothetical protein CPF_1909 [Clostridium perfringens ATCC 13124]|uniref:Uncharacterized protein n=1 Tax=Clostridium perfringens (strain ATCC 13124 / DSM 756 / JCM 1290 / NCIMB 6125 / NCTC 8237 / Type A) TaxID=195103 RepID=A0A0H2YV31_CLOP1|nr:hypothetical protein CPF_1909 [Clostridium perfringens ATCC 13124]
MERYNFSDIIKLEIFIFKLAKSKRGLINEKRILLKAWKSNYELYCKVL